jgi:hypothetical protein
MQLTRLVPTLGLFLVLGALVGCGSESQRITLDKVDDDGMLVQRKGIRTFQKQSRESTKSNSADRKGGRPRAKSGS